VLRVKATQHRANVVVEWCDAVLSFDDAATGMGRFERRTFLSVRTTPDAGEIEKHRNGRSNAARRTPRTRTASCRRSRWRGWAVSIVAERAGSHRGAGRLGRDHVQLAELLKQAGAHPGLAGGAADAVSASPRHRSDGGEGVCTTIQRSEFQNH